MIWGCPLLPKKLSRFKKNPMYKTSKYWFLPLLALKGNCKKCNNYFAITIVEVAITLEREIKKRRLRAITFKEAIEKRLILHIGKMKNLIDKLYKYTEVSPLQLIRLRRKWQILKENWFWCVIVNYCLSFFFGFSLFKHLCKSDLICLKNAQALKPKNLYINRFIHPSILFYGQLFYRVSRSNPPDL